MERISSIILPVIVIFIVAYGALKKLNVFECFVDGAKKGLVTFASLLPVLTALIVAVGMLRGSGGLDLITKLLTPVSKLLGIPVQVLPLCILSPISGSGSLAVFEDILRNYGPDSIAGRVASVIAGSSETTFYTATVYFGSVGVTRTRHTIPSALIADLVNFIVSSLIIRITFA